MSDFLKKRPIIDVDTPNISFLQVAKDLHTLGIKNNTFFLKLYDPALKGINPHSPKLPEEIVIRIINECTRNPWYFLREVVRIPVQGGTGVPFLLTRANLAASWCFLNGIDHYEVIPRQIGKTQSALAILLWAFLFGTTNSEIMFLNKTQLDANGNLERLRKQRDLLPPYLQFKFIFNEDGKAIEKKGSVQTLSNLYNNNKIVAFPKATSKEKAEKIGRGATQPIQYYDEVEFIDFIKTIVETAGPSFNSASKNARENNAAYCRIFTSTPGDLDTNCGQEALMIVENTCKFQEQFYDWDREKGIDFIKEYINTNSSNGIVYIEYSYKQLGKDENWLKEISRVLNNNPLKIKREVFLKRMRGSSLSPYEPEDLAIIDDNKGKVKEEIFINGLFKINLYDELIKDRIYFLGIDIADGYGGDNSTIIIFDPYTLKPVGDFKSSLISIPQFYKLLVTLVRKFIPRAILCIERNRGAALIALLHKSPIRHTIYFDKNKNFLEVDEKVDPKGFLKLDSMRRKCYGIWTGGESRRIMFGLLEVHIRDYKQNFVSHDLINEIMSLVRTRTGKIEAANGFHDDMVLAFLMCLYVYYHGNNLQRFGFVRGQIPGDDERNKGLTYDETINQFDNETYEYFKDTGGQYELNEYDKKIAQEIEKARKESIRLNKLINPINIVEPINDDNDDEYDNGSLDLNIFDELNDL